MESYEREWETGALHWGIDDESVLPMHQYSWGVQRILMGQSVLGATEHESYDKFRLHLYGPLSAIANYYVRDEPGNPIARFQRVLEAVTNTGALVTYSPTAGEDVGELPVLHALWSNKYGHFYTAADADGFSFRRGAGMVFPRGSPQPERLDALFGELEVSLREMSIPKADRKVEAEIASAFDRAETAMLLQSLTNAAASDASAEIKNWLNLQIEMDGPFSMPPLPKSACPPPESGILLPFNPRTPDEGDLTRLRYLKEEVFCARELNAAERETVANPFTMVPPDRSRAPGLAGREGLPEMYLHFRTEFVGSIVQMFVGGCLKMHVNAIHYVLLVNRRAIPPNGITLRHLMENGTPAEKARSPLWILDPGKNNAVESVEGYRIAEEVLSMISSEMQERVYPFAFAEILEELAEPSFAQNADITREELECIVWLGLDSCFARAYFTQQTNDFDEVLPGMMWLADSAFVHEWSLVKARQMAITAIQNGQIPVQKNWNLWRKWKSLNGLETSAGAGLSRREAALAETKKWYKVLMRELCHIAKPFLGKEARSLNTLLKNLETLVLNRYILWLWGSGRYTRGQPAQNAVNFWKADEAVPDDKGSAAFVVKNVLARELTVDAFQRPYSVLHEMQAEYGVATDLLNHIYVSEEEVLADLFVWGTQVPQINSTTPRLEEEIGYLSVRTEHLYKRTVLDNVWYWPVIRRWARPGVAQSGEPHYVFSIRNLLQETRAFDVMARRAARFIPPIVVRTGKQCIGDRPAFLLVTQQPWLRRYRNVRVQWRVVHLEEEKDLVAYNWKNVDVFDRITIPVRRAVEWACSQQRRDNCGRIPTTIALQLNCLIHGQAVTTYSVRSDEYIAQTPVHLSARVELEIRQ